MAIRRGTMTEEQRKFVAIGDLRAFDKGRRTSTGGSNLDLIFPTSGLADGKAEIGRRSGDIVGTVK